jgi:hypothetical protein
VNGTGQIVAVDLSDSTDRFFGHTRGGLAPPQQTMLAKLSILALTLAAALPAHADPITDFKNGTSLYLRSATVSLDSESARSVGAVLIRKSAGTLDITFKASDLGLPVPVTVRARGAVSRSRIVFTIDETYSPRIDLGMGNYLSRLTGQLTATPTWDPGAPTANHGNVKLDLLDSSFVTAAGSWGSKRISINDTHFAAGVVQPRLAAFAPDTARICSDREDTMQAFTVRLAAAARTGGAPVELQSFHNAIRVPRFVIVPTGRQTVTLQGRIKRGFAGTVRLAAASGGVRQPIDVVVHAQQDCAVQP